MMKYVVEQETLSFSTFVLRGCVELTLLKDPSAKLVERASQTTRTIMRHLFKSISLSMYLDNKNKNARRRNRVQEYYLSLHIFVVCVGRYPHTVKVIFACVC